MYAKLYKRGDKLLTINTEIRKGILFIRLKGELTKDTVKKLKEDVTMMIKDNGIKNVVFNINNLNVIDMEGINELLYNYEFVKKNRGNSCLCGINNSLVKHRINNSRILKYMYEASDELGAINILNLSKENEYDT